MVRASFPPPPHHSAGVVASDKTPPLLLLMWHSPFVLECVSLIIIFHPAFPQSRSANDGRRQSFIAAECEELLAFLYLRDQFLMSIQGREEKRITSVGLNISVKLNKYFLVKNTFAVSENLTL